MARQNKKSERYSKRKTSTPTKKRNTPFGVEKVLPFDYKATRLLAEYLTERGKIVPRRVTGLTQYQQKRLVESIKRARQLGLLPYTVTHAVRD